MIYLYRTIESDEDGDPLDHGIVSQDGWRGAALIVSERLASLGISCGFKLYPQQAPGLDRKATIVTPGLFVDAAPPMTFNAKGTQHKRGTT